MCHSIESFIRHNQKVDIFKFVFEENALTFSRSILHVFLLGRDWIQEKKPSLLYTNLADNYNKKRQGLVLNVHRICRVKGIATHSFKVIESYHKIPPGLGNWVEIDFKNGLMHWLKNPNIEHGLIVRGMETWMHSIISADRKIRNHSLKCYVEIDVDTKTRGKRNAVLDCNEGGNEKRCCRYPLKINFSSFGWNFIVAPQHFDAYFCNGECNVGYLEKYTHTHITSLSTSAKPCCSPQKLNPLTLLYFDMTMKLMYSTIPNMSVEKCSCS